MEEAPNQKTPLNQKKRPDRPSDSESFLEVVEQIEENMHINADNKWECKVCRCFSRKDHLNSILRPILRDCPLTVQCVRALSGQEVF